MSTVDTFSSPDARLAILQYCSVWNRSFSSLLGLKERLGDVWSVVAALAESFERPELPKAAEVRKRAVHFGIMNRGGETLPHKFRICLRELEGEHLIEIVRDKDRGRKKIRAENEFIFSTKYEVKPGPELRARLVHHAREGWLLGTNNEMSLAKVEMQLSAMAFENLLLKTGNCLFEFIGRDYAKSWTTFRETLKPSGLDDRLMENPILWIAFAAMLYLNRRATGREIDQAITSSGLMLEAGDVTDALRLLPHSWHSEPNGLENTYEMPKELEASYQKYVTQISAAYHGYRWDFAQAVSAALKANI